jgi:hypothetical protein
MVRIGINLLDIPGCTFGEEYDVYEKSVNELFPFPLYLFPRMRININK